MVLEECLESFKHQKMVDGIGDNSIKNYDATLSLFIRSIGPDLPVSALSLDQVQAYIVSLRKTGISKATMASYIRNIKIFLRWLSEEEYVDFPYYKIKVPRSPKKNVRQYSDQDIALVLSLVSSSEEWIRWRNIAIIVLMLDTGLRQLEVCRIDKSVVHFDSGRIMITGKGDKDRVVKMGQFTSNIIKRYLQECPFKDTKHLFCGRRGDRLTGNTIRIFMYHLQEQLPFHFSSHKLRHNFATNFTVDQYVRTGSCDELTLQILMGHSDSKTTQRYIHLGKEFIAANNSYSHLDGISRNLLKEAIGE